MSCQSPPVMLRTPPPTPSLQPVANRSIKVLPETPVWRAKRRVHVDQGACPLSSSQARTTLLLLARVTCTVGVQGVGQPPGLVSHDCTSCSAEMWQHPGAGAITLSHPLGQAGQEARAGLAVSQARGPASWGVSVNPRVVPGDLMPWAGQQLGLSRSSVLLNWVLAPFAPGAQQSNMAGNQLDAPFAWESPAPGSLPRPGQAAGQFGAQVPEQATLGGAVRSGWGGWGGPACTAPPPSPWLQQPAAVSIQKLESVKSGGKGRHCTETEHCSWELGMGYRAAPTPSPGTTLFPTPSGYSSYPPPQDAPTPPDLHHAAPTPPPHLIPLPPATPSTMLLLPPPRQHRLCFYPPHLVLHYPNPPPHLMPLTPPPAPDAPLPRVCP